MGRDQKWHQDFDPFSHTPGFEKLVLFPESLISLWVWRMGLGQGSEACCLLRSTLPETEFPSFHLSEGSDWEASRKKVVGESSSSPQEWAPTV